MRGDDKLYGANEGSVTKMATQQKQHNANCKLEKLPFISYKSAKCELMKYFE